MTDEELDEWFSALPRIDSALCTDCISIRVMGNHPADRIDVLYPLRAVVTVRAAGWYSTILCKLHDDHIYYTAFFACPAKVYAFANFIANTTLLPIKRIM